MNLDWEQPDTKGGDHFIVVGLFKAKLYYARLAHGVWRVAFYVHDAEVRKLEAPWGVVLLSDARTWAKDEFKQWVVSVAALAASAARLLKG